MKHNRITVRVPASSANLGPGFDTLAIALDRYLWIELHPADTTSIRTYGTELNNIKLKENNLVYRTIQHLFTTVGQEMPTFQLSMYGDIPLSRGLGSSAAAIVGGLVAANEWLDNPLSQHQLFAIANQLEGHPDNVGAALFGGMIVAVQDEADVHHIQITPPHNLKLLLAIPRYKLSTHKARSVLPKTITIKDAIYNISRSSLFVAAIQSGRLDLLTYATGDRLHQPYRAELIPGMKEILTTAQKYGALGAALSGAGPTILLFADEHVDKEKLERFVARQFEQHTIEVTLQWANPETRGATVFYNDPSLMQSLIQNRK